jgi:hypothetical protein
MTPMTRMGKEEYPWNPCNPWSRQAGRNEPRRIGPRMTSMTGMGKEVPMKWACQAGLERGAGMSETGKMPVLRCRGVPLGSAQKWFCPHGLVYLTVGTGAGWDGYDGSQGGVRPRERAQTHAPTPHNAWVSRPKPFLRDLIRCYLPPLCSNSRILSTANH